MSIKKVRRGDDLLPHLTAEWYNSTVPPEDGGPSTAGDIAAPAGNGCRVRIQNNTGSNLNRYSIVGLGGPVFNPNYGIGESFQSFLNGLPLIAGALPVVATHAYRFAVLLESCASGNNCEALAIGVTPVQVNVTSTSHTYADVTAGVTSYLTSGTSGGAKLLTTPTSTGLQWCLARIGLPPVPDARSFVMFDMKGALNGFNTSGSNVKLDNSNQTGWYGSENKFGSEDLCGIEYVNGETAPQTNGIFKATKSGTWLVSVWFPEIRLVSTELSTPASGTTTFTTSGPSTGTAHTHTVTIPRSGMVGPRIYCRCWKKPTGSAIGTTGDYHLMTFPYIETSGAEWEFSFDWQFVLPLLVNEKCSFEWAMTGSDRTAYTFDFKGAGDGIGRVSFDFLDDYIGDSLGWRTVGSDP